MKDYEVDQPILNSPYDEPKEYWQISAGEEPVRIKGRRKAMYFYRPPAEHGEGGMGGPSVPVELTLVNRIRERLQEWRDSDYAGATRTSLELIKYWRREGRFHRLFFAQIEAAETIILLTEARQDFLQGIEIPLDEPGEEGKQKGYKPFLRYACKMATGSGKTTVMGMVAAWSILNKICSRSDNRFSDVILVVCPNVTIRNRLRELDPATGEASLYRTRDLVPARLMPDLSKGRVIVTNWHVFEPQATGAAGARVIRAGVPTRRQDIIAIGPKSTTARGTRYLTHKELERQIAVGLIKVQKEFKDAQGNIRKVAVESVKYVESDAALVNRVLGRQIGSRQNILVFNDEAHHAYRIRRTEADEDEDSLFGEEEESWKFFEEATIWVDGLDRIHKLRGINF